MNKKNSKKNSIQTIKQINPNKKCPNKKKSIPRIKIGRKEPAQKISKKKKKIKQIKNAQTKKSIHRIKKRPKRAQTKKIQKIKITPTQNLHVSPDNIKRFSLIRNKAK